MERSLLRFKAFAKINLFLEILGKRDDGYHEINSLMVNVDLPDVLEFRKTASGFSLTTDSKEVPSGFDNICLKAAETIREYANHKEGMEIALSKRIPVEAGLGGGSSDAACTLVAANRLWDLGLSWVELEGVAEKVGSDVPFFVRGGAQLAGGRGERLEPLPDFPEIWFVLVTPSVRVSSGWAYSSVKIGLTSTEHKSKISTTGADFDALSIGKMLRNDLESGVIDAHPVVRELKNALVSHGAIGSLMSGSGSTVFGVARGRTSATAIASKMNRPGLSVRVARTVRTGWVEIAQN